MTFSVIYNFYKKVFFKSVCQLNTLYTFIIIFNLFYYIYFKNNHYSISIFIKSANSSNFESTKLQ